MASTRIAAAVMVIGLTALMPVGVAPAAQVGTTIDAVAGRLLQEQVTTGPSAGNWEIGFNGSIVAGMIRAYEYTSTGAYADAARLGGDYIIYDAQNGLFGDDAYALMRLSQQADDPQENRWRTVLDSFYQQIRADEGGTFDYVDSYRTIDPSTAVFYLAHHTVAAYYVNAADRGIWRSGLITYLGQVTNASAEYPVMALGVATWALAQTGPLDETPFGGGRTLADLPSLLLSHQVPEGMENAGTFYWRFDHGDDGSGSPVSGYTEDTVFAVLGLLAASRANPEVHVGAAVEAARDALLDAPDAEGRVHVSLTGDGLAHPAFAGELLLVLPELDAAWAMGKWLVSGQVKDGVPAGTWAGEEDFTGTLLAGVFSATKRFPHDVQFQQALILAGQRVLSHANLFGDEAFAVRRLSEAAANPSDNPFRTALTEFYGQVKDAEGGTEQYVAEYADVEESTAVFYLAHHALAAYYVDAADKALWRDALIRTLSQVDDSAEYPVMALAAATWALAQTGPLDATPVGDGPAAPWDGKTLAELPSMLLDHQVPEGQPYAGSFFWRFDHAEDGAEAAGYTEDAVFGLLSLRALMSSGDISSAPALEAAITAAAGALAEGVDGSGRVYEHLSKDGVLYYSYAAETLMALP